jgi:hypothetical protein
MRILVAAAILALVPLSLSSQRADSARKVFVVPGERAGPSVHALTNYPEVQPRQAGVMDWQHYHTSEEIETWMRKWAEEHPEIVELYSVGESFGGRTLWQLTLTNKKSGKDTDKPAAFFEGGRHSGEITATESAFYLAWYLIENYGKDTAVTALLDRAAVYIRPLNNPDGSDMYRLTAQANRSSVRPHDTDRDGLLDEDPGEDLDGDGYIRDMRVQAGAGKGEFVLDTADRSGRLMRRVGEGKGDWNVYSEGIDNDLDGRYNEDGIGGLDLHRNYPENWRPMPGMDRTGRGYTQNGAGEFPLSEPETRHTVLFVLQNPNISVVNSMDTRVPMHLRPPSTSKSEERMYPEDLDYYPYYDSVGLSFTNYPWAGDVYWTYANRNREEGEERGSPLFGHGPDFGYFSYGSL